jgi:hypothetical protein
MSCTCDTSGPAHEHAGLKTLAPKLHIVMCTFANGVCKLCSVMACMLTQTPRRPAWGITVAVSLLLHIQAFRAEFVRWLRLRDVDWRSAFEAGLARDVKRLRREAAKRDGKRRHEAWAEYRRGLLAAATDATVSGAGSQGQQQEQAQRTVGQGADVRHSVEK